MEAPVVHGLWGAVAIIILRHPTLTLTSPCACNLLRYFTCLFQWWRLDVGGSLVAQELTTTVSVLLRASFRSACSFYSLDITSKYRPEGCHCNPQAIAVISEGFSRRIQLSVHVTEGRILTPANLHRS